MQKRVVIIQGHPDPDGEHFCHALAEAYAAGARAAGHAVSTISVAAIDLPLLNRWDEWRNGKISPVLGLAKNQLDDADHLLVVFPLWLGGMPAVLKAFFEQVLRPGYAADARSWNWDRLLAGRSARLLITMDMPLRRYFSRFRILCRGSAQRGVLEFIGIRPLRETLVGNVRKLDSAARERWIARLTDMGRRLR